MIQAFLYRRIHFKVVERFQEGKRVQYNTWRCKVGAKYDQKGGARYLVRNRYGGLCKAYEVRIPKGKPR